MSAHPLRQIITKRCAQLGITQSQLAERADLTRAYLFRLCTGHTTNPGILTLQRLASALELPATVIYRAFEPRVLSAGPAMEHEGLPENVGGFGQADVWRFLADVTVPDHSVVLPGERFVKTWAVQNVGAVPWSGRSLLRVDEELAVYPRHPLGSSRAPWLPAIQDIHLASLGTRIDIPPTQPGEVVELSVEFAAPNEACSVASIWRPANPHGQALYGPRCFLQAVVTVLS